jgi:site-specific recombinase XerD
MPKLSVSVPRYRKHRASGQAIVTIGGKDYYLGPHGTKTSKAEYDRLVFEWLAAGRIVPEQEQGLTVSTLCAEFWRFAQKHYLKRGNPTGTAENYKPALSMLRQCYGSTPAADFGPRALKGLRERMIQAGQSRRYINDNVDRIRRVFRWGASEELLPAAVHEALQTVEALPKDRSAARETAPVPPVDETTVEATLPNMPPIVSDMVQFQRLTGARPTEVCIIRPCDVDRSGDVWRYVPESHKTEHHGRERVVFIGPRAQDILRPYLLREATAYCFQPKESERKRNAQRKSERKTPMTPSQAARKTKRGRQRAPQDRYTKDSYRRAIHRACDKTFLPGEPLALQPGETDKQRDERLTETEREALRNWQSSHRWAPNQLRHSAATDIRKRYGAEAAQVVLGHSKLSTTEVYAERDYAKAETVAREVG